MWRDELDRLTVDWDDVTKAYEQTNDLLTEISSDKQGLRQMISEVRDDPGLFEQCERHRLLDRIVLYNGDNGIRLRLHFSTAEHRDRPHDHRFTFTSRILNGGYRHTRHELRGDVDPDIPWHVQNDIDARLVDTTVVPMFSTDQTKGSSYTLHHTEIHTTYTRPETVSLFLRGPSQKDRSLILERETNKLWWRYGAEKELEQRRKEKKMTTGEFETLVARLEHTELV